MLNCKQDFPLFQNDPDVVFLDNGASTQRPDYVIDGVDEYIKNHYANIHRGVYKLSEDSEEYYHASKEKCAEFLNCKASEIIYTYNATYWLNIIAQSLVRSKILGEGDAVLLGIWEHHSNIVPRQILAEMFGFEVRFLEIDENYNIDRNDFEKKYDDKVKVVSLCHVSNVSWKIYDLKEVKSKLREDTFFMADGSQAMPHFAVDVQDFDAYVFTGHKMMVYSWPVVIYLKKERIKTLQPMMGGWGTVKDVTQDGHEIKNNNEKFEFGTPNMIGAVSLLKTFEYIEKIWGYEKIRAHEQELTVYALDKFAELGDKIQLLGPTDPKERVWCFSFFIPEITNFNVIGEKFAEHNICIRCGAHCAYPLHRFVDMPGTCRASLFLFNDKSDIDKFFEVLHKIISS